MIDIKNDTEKFRLSPNPLKKLVINWECFRLISWDQSSVPVLPIRVKTLSDAYFKRIEAIEFTIKQDDGTLPENLGKADIILVGVSRTGKTPLSTYIAQKGYKVANVPFVMGVEPPKTVFEVEPRKVFALKIQLVVLQAIRRTRAKTLGVDTEGENRYSGFDLVREELDFASKIYAKNPGWAVIDVTNKAIEQTAAVILRQYLQM
ncbi:unnamed protein product [Brassica napus]|nr:unnamed protein product [Brassica napus]